jgi:hypothetical protein
VQLALQERKMSDEEEVKGKENKCTAGGGPEGLRNKKSDTADTQIAASPPPRMGKCRGKSKQQLLQAPSSLYLCTHSHQQEYFLPILRMRDRFTNESFISLQ